MAVNLSPIGGVAGQFFDNNGNPLTGGKLYTYAAGTTTNQATYTSVSGGTAHTNPIVLDSAGRVPSGEIWLTDGLAYKFVVKTSADVTIGSYDNLEGLSSITLPVDSSDVTYNPPFTASVLTTAEDKLAQYVSVKDFGAVGDGVTDDTAALQSFFDACQNGKGYIPPGVYKITATLNLHPQYSYNIEGAVYKNTANAGTVIYNAGTSTAIFVNNEPYTPPNFDSQIRLANLTVSGNSGSQHGIYASHAMIFLENVWLTGHGGHGLYLERAYSSAFKQVVCADNYKYGALIYIAGNQLHFDHCVFNGNSILDGYAGMRTTSLTDPLSENFGLVFTSCDFTGNGNSSGVTTAIGAQVQEAFPVSFIGCYWESNKSNNLYVDSSSKNITVSGCFFQDADNLIDGVDGLIYENNHHLQVSGSMQVNINGGMPTSRLPTRMFGNTYYGGATANPQNGVSENIQLWYTEPPTSGTWLRGDIVRNSDFQSGGMTPGWTCVNPGTPGTWLPMPQAPSVYANWGDSGATLTPFTSFPTNIWQSPLTANRTVTLNSTSASSGVKFRVTRAASATGAFNLNVGTGPLKALSAGQWCDVEWDGSAWQVTAAGSL